MGGGNGAKAKQARERAAAKGPAESKSQLKSNAAAKTIICKVCKQDFQSTTKKPALEQHATNKHSGKGFTDCFDTVD